MTVKTNIWNLEVGDTISFINKRNSDVSILVDRVEEKSWYMGSSRNSWGTLDIYSKQPKFKITKKT